MHVGKTTGASGLLRLTLTQRLMVLALIALLPGAFALLYNELALRRARLDALHVDAARAARLTQSELEQIFEGVRGVIQTIALSPVVRAFEAPACASFLIELVARLPQLTTIAVIDGTGSLRCHAGSALPEAPRGFGDRTYLREALDQDRFVVGRHATGRITGNTVLPLAVPIMDQAGAPGGVVVAGLRLDWLNAHLRERGVVPGGAVTIADRDGVIIAREPFPERFVGTRIPDAYMRLVNGTTAGTEEVLSQDGTRRVIGYIPPRLTATNLYISAGSSSSDVYDAVDRATQRGFLLLFLGLVGTLALSWLFARVYIRRPLMRLVDATQRWRDGDFEVRTHMRAADGEIESVGDAFDRLADDLRRQQRARDAASAHRELLLAELNHRVKNTLATVQSIAALSFRGEQTADAFGAFQGRLLALSRGHDLLTQVEWASADLREIVLQATAPLRAEGERRFHISGPATRVPPNATVSVAMMLHELCTNAVKYGALMGDGGRVEIAWQTRAAEGETLIDLQWQEHGGPAVTPPQRRGFGMRLLETLARELNGTVDIAFASEGLRCCLNLRVSAATTD